MGRTWPFPGGGDGLTGWNGAEPGTRPARRRRAPPRSQEPSRCAGRPAARATSARDSRAGALHGWGRALAGHPQRGAGAATDPVAERTPLPGRKHRLVLCAKSTVVPRRVREPSPSPLRGERGAAPVQPGAGEAGGGGAEPPQRESRARRYPYLSPHPSRHAGGGPSPWPPEAGRALWTVTQVSLRCCPLWVHSRWEQGPCSNPWPLSAYPGRGFRLPREEICGRHRYLMDHPGRYEAASG